MACAQMEGRPFEKLDVATAADVVKMVVLLLWIKTGVAIFAGTGIALLGEVAPSLRYSLLLIASLVIFWFPALMLILGGLWIRLKIAVRKRRGAVLELPWTLRLMRISPYIAGLIALVATFATGN